jgi:hypothetical protein
MDGMHDTRAFLSWGLSTPVDTFLIASYFPRVPIIIVFTDLLSATTSSDPHVLLVIAAAGAPNFESQSSLALPTKAPLRPQMCFNGRPLLLTPLVNNGHKFVGGQILHQLVTIDHRGYGLAV